MDVQLGDDVPLGRQAFDTGFVRTPPAEEPVDDQASEDTQPSS